MFQTGKSTFNPDSYVYLIISKIDGRIYVGVKRKQPGIKPLADGYWGSGTDIKKAVEKLYQPNLMYELYQDQ